MASTRKRHFNQAQDDHIKGILSILSTKQALPGFNVKTWKKEQIDKILTSPLFAGKLASSEEDSLHGTTPQGWKERVQTKFKNYISRGASRDLLQFSPLSGKALFEKERRGPLTLLAVERATTSGSRLDCCYNACEQEMWSSLTPAEREEFDTRAGKVPVGVQSKQADFPRAVGQALTKLCRDKELGDLELVLLWAFREPDGSLRHGSVHAHASDNVPDIADEVVNWVPVVVSAWEEFADRVIPSSDAVPSKKIPLFPDFDDKSINGNEVAELLRTYICQLWEFSMETNTIPPWDELASKPSIYYDDQKFKLPEGCKLQAPESLPLMQLFALAEYFTSLSEPFVLYNKAKIEDFINKDGQQRPVGVEDSLNSLTKEQRDVVNEPAGSEKGFEKSPAELMVGEDPKDANKVGRVVDELVGSDKDATRPAELMVDEEDPMLVNRAQRDVANKPGDSEKSPKSPAGLMVDGEDPMDVNRAQRDVVNEPAGSEKGFEKSPAELIVGEDPKDADKAGRVVDELVGSDKDATRPAELMVDEEDPMLVNRAQRDVVNEPAGSEKGFEKSPAELIVGEDPKDANKAGRVVDELVGSDKDATRPAELMVDEEDPMLVNRAQRDVANKPGDSEKSPKSPAGLMVDGEDPMDVNRAQRDVVNEPGDSEKGSKRPAGFMVDGEDPKDVNKPQDVIEGEGNTRPPVKKRKKNETDPHCDAGVLLRADPRLESSQVLGSCERQRDEARLGDGSRRLRRSPSL
ncbi:hypothetical protein C8R47DRAFT_1228775 [Mycena vitilis]|nr:hypothetical protein C8R47DRAFT_1228775 [Mycena vitilis]